MEVNKNNNFLYQSRPIYSGDLKRKMYDIGVTQKHYSQLTGNNIESTGIHINKAAPHNTVNGGFFFFSIKLFML